MSKDRIIGVLGERRLLLPGLVNAGLAANDRAKFLFTVLQAARWHADHPGASPPDLERERLASGIDESWLDDVVRGSRVNNGGYVMPGADRLVRRLFDETEAMARPIIAESDPPGDEVVAFTRRLNALRRDTAVDDMHVAASLVDSLTRIDAADGDSLHRLVMDLHKALNRLQASIALERIDGAAVYGLDPTDVPLVRAFMRGVNATAPLKFDHPGLDTTATRAGGRLVIQNDIGTTDAHVLVVHVEGLTVTVTCTDVHLERLNFFRAMSDGFDVAWRTVQSGQAEAVGEGEPFHVLTGTLAAVDQPALERYLTHLGSRIVFLIDWNRARKRLRLLVPKKAALELLLWAATNNYGHRGFLMLGGDRLVFDTLTFAAKTPLRYGAQLDELLGEADAVDYLKFLFRAAAQGLLAGKSENLIREEAKAELVTRFNSAETQVMALVAEHAALVVESAMALRDLLMHGPASEGRASAERTARRAKDWESRADQLVTETRELVKRAGTSDALRRVLEEADNAIDDLEEGTFLLTLPPVATAESLCRTQQQLAALVVAACSEWVKAVESARHVHRGGPREDLQDFLAAVDRIASLEHEGDLSERATTAALLLHAQDFRQLHVFTTLAGQLEDATDALMRAGLMLRDHILNDVITA